MKYAFLMIPLAAAFVVGNSHAQARIYRCPGNSYINNAAEAQQKNCKLVEGGNVTVVEGTRVQGASGNAPIKVAAAAPSSAGQRVDASEQRSRDSDARQILEAELKKAEARQAELQKEYNNGEPELLGPEHRNRQKYTDRVAELKTSIARNESDIAGIRRELTRASQGPR
ncbi:MAG: hypothetical protein HYX47_18165 [Burkholderiales bacterium]|nr:hypothetical protein [Burkholderiales bacterium]